MLWPSDAEPHRLADVAARCVEALEDWHQARGIGEEQARAWAENVWSPMILWLADRAEQVSTPPVIGLCGPPGAGKSTWSNALSIAARHAVGLRMPVLSIDDFYLLREQRLAMAERVHALLQTRGVPGTHDVGLASRTIDRLVAGVGKVLLPRFDKATDDRAPKSSWPVWEGPCDLVLFEGWCVGARAQQPRFLDQPINALERDEDPDASWRWYVNRKLGGEYQQLFQRLDLLIMLRAPSLECVFRWREDQEAELRRRAKEGAGMTPQEVRRFVMHDERLITHIQEEMPHRADVLIELAENHRPTRVKLAEFC